MSEQGNFTAIRVSTLRGDIKIPFDVYIRVAGKYIHYCRRGSSFEGERLARLKGKRLKQMFIRPEDEIPYRQYLEESVNSAYDSKSGRDPSVRAEVIQGFQEAATENYLESLADEMAYNHVHSSSQRFVELLQTEPWAAQAILRIENTEQSITHHSINVATLATAMAVANNMRDAQLLQTMALGCMLHDVDHYMSGFNVARPIESLSKEEMETYREHPISGAHRFQGIKFLDQLVLKIILEHEEHSDGSGFPKGLFERDMDPLVMIAATANAFDRMTSFEGLSRKEALKDFLIKKMGQYPLNYMQILQNILKDQGLV